MPNYSAKILGNAVSSLNAQQATIANISNNIANVNTAGYSRRTASLETRSTSSDGGLSIGNGVQVADIVRQADSFIDGILRGAISEQGGAQVESDFLSRIEKLFSLTDDSQTIGSTFTAFFGALDTLATNPSSLELRSVVIERAQDLVGAIQNTYNSLANLQTEADQRIAVELETVNGITAQIADLNTKVIASEARGFTAADERDKREYLIQQLSEKLSFSVTELSDGSVNITLPSGFPLVSGSTSRSLEATTSPSFATPGTLPPSLGGGVLSYIVYDYSSSGTPAHIDLTQMLADGDGTIGGLLRIRGYASPTNTVPFEADGVLAELATHVEAITRDLLTRFNNTYKAPDAANANASQAGDLNGTAPGIFGFFTFSGAADSNANGLPDAADLTVAATSRTNFSSVLDLAFTDPVRLAAARDDNYGASGSNPPYTFSDGDNQNVLALSALRTSSNTFAAGSSFTTTGTYDEVYVGTVTRVGNLSTRAATELNVTQTKLVAAQARRDEVSGVSLDEEYTSLIRYQKAYEASARLVRVATELLDTIVGLI